MCRWGEEGEKFFHTCSGPAVMQPSEGVYSGGRPLHKLRRKEKGSNNSKAWAARIAEVAHTEKKYETPEGGECREKKPRKAKASRRSIQGECS